MPDVQQPGARGINGRLKVIGKPRNRRTLATLIVNTRYIVNWRLQKVFTPFVVAEMTNNFGWTNADSDKTVIENIVKTLAEQSMPTDGW